MKKVLVFILSGILSFLIWATISSAGENIKIDITIRDFINSATYLEDKSDNKNKYYVVKSKEKLDIDTYTESNDVMYPGGPGDIILTKIAAVDVPVINEGISFYVGGHAALAGFPFNDNSHYLGVNSTLEITGFGYDITTTTMPKSTWYNTRYDLIMGVRVKTSLENRFKAFNRALSFYGEKYNYSFMFNKNHTKYCSDLVSQSYEYAGIDLDYDNVACTVLDLLANPMVYLTYVSTLDKDGCRHIYYLDD